MNTFARLVRPVLVASVATAGLAGAALLPAQAVPTPSATPVATSKASPRSTDAASPKPSATTSATKRATSSPTPSRKQAASARLGVQLTAPKGTHDKVTFVFTGLKDGEWVDGVGHPVGWTKEAPYIIEVQGKADGSTLTLTQDAPTAGWPVGKEYVFTFTHQDGTKVTRSFTLRAGGSDTRAHAPAEKSTSGGLARTGF